MRDCHTDFHRGCTSLHSHQQWVRVSFSPQPLRHLLLPVLLIIAILTGVRWYLSVSLSCISLIPSQVEHIFMCLLAICMSSWQKCQPFLIGLFRCCWVEWVLCIFWIWIPYQRFCVQVSFPIQLVVFLFCWLLFFLCRNF